MEYINKTDICIVGLGPSGLGAALTIAKSNLGLDLLCMEIGGHQLDKVCSLLKNGICTKDKPCKMISGVGGCSSLSGGKMGIFPAGIELENIFGSRDLAEKKLAQAFSLINKYISLIKPIINKNEIERACNEFKELGFEYKYYDSYLFSPREMQMAYREMIFELESSGTKFLMNTQLLDIDFRDNKFVLSAVGIDGKSITIVSKYLVLGLGRSGRDFLRLINDKFYLGANNNFLEVGVRLEFPTSIWPDINKNHNDLKLLFNNARTFCVCKDGKIAPYCINDIHFTEGFFDPEYVSGLTNLGIMIRLEPSEENQTIVDQIRNNLIITSDGMPIGQKLTDYLSIESDNSNEVKNSFSYWKPGNINKIYPPVVSLKVREAIDYFASKLIPEEDLNKIYLFAPEIDYGGLSLPLNSDFSIRFRMYLIGDCTGKFRGILPAFCSGIVCAESIIGGLNDD
ncbi:MAG: hypothetical protein ACYDHX_05815 [Methanothrix sp.]